MERGSQDYLVGDKDEDAGLEFVEEFDDVLVGEE